MEDAETGNCSPPLPRDADTLAGHVRWRVADYAAIVGAQLELMSQGPRADAEHRSDGDGPAPCA